MAVCIRQGRRRAVASPEPAWLRSCGVVPTVVLLAAWLQMAGECSPVLAAPSPRPVKRVQWSDALASSLLDDRWAASEADREGGAAELQEREPVVLTGAPAAQWAAHTSWNASDLWLGGLCEVAPSLFDIHVSVTPGFRYLDGRAPLARHYGSGWDGSAARATIMPEMSCTEFATAALGLSHAATEEARAEALEAAACNAARENAGANESTDCFLYVSSDLMLLSEHLLEDVVPLGAMADMCTSEDEYLSGNWRRDCDLPRINAWVGSEGSTALLHYDSSHNFFTQVHGSKRVTLLSPQFAEHARVHSRLHPGHRQAAAPIGEVLTHDATSGVVQQVVLNAGDVLYIPPLHLHHIEALTESISVNVYRNALEVGRIQRAFAIFPDMPGHTSLSQRACLLTRFVSEFATELKGGSSAISTALSMRWAALLDGNDGILPGFSKGDILRDSGLLCEARHGACQECKSVLSETPAEVLTQHDEAAQRAHDLIKHAPETIVLDYVEEVAYRVLYRNVAAVAAWLVRCHTSDGASLVWPCDDAVEL